MVQTGFSASAVLSAVSEAPEVVHGGLARLRGAISMVRKVMVVRRPRWTSIATSVTVALVFLT